MVWMPGSGRQTVRVWSGLVGFQDMPAWLLADRADGAILTSPTAISGSVAAVQFNADAIVLWANLVVVWPAVLVGTRIAFRRSRSLVSRVHASSD